MDQVVRDCSRANDQLKRIASALGHGIILVDCDGQIAWMDESMRRRVNGGLQNLVSSIRRSGPPAVDCFVSTVDVTIDGEQSVVCVIHVAGDQEEPERDLIAAIEAVMTDTSWFTRTIVEKLRAWRQGARPEAQPSDLDLLTEREREVLGLICEGHGDAEMSRALHISQNTVRNHVASLYRKIGVNRRSAAIIWARQRAITSRKALGPTWGRRSFPDSHAK